MREEVTKDMKLTYPQNFVKKKLFPWKKNPISGGEIDMKTT